MIVFITGYIFSWGILSVAASNYGISCVYVLLNQVWGNFFYTAVYTLYLYDNDVCVIMKQFLAISQHVFASFHTVCFA